MAAKEIQIGDHQVKVSRKRQYPSKYLETPDAWERIEELAGIGLNKTQIALCLGIPTSLLSPKMMSYKVQEAMEAGKAKAIATVSQTLYDKAVKGDYQSISFFLKNRAAGQWADKQEVAYTGPAVSFNFDMDNKDGKEERKEESTLPKGEE